jgi:hypothetical protein
LYHLLHSLGSASRTRDWLTSELNLDVRGFYRDLEFLRGVGIGVSLAAGGYVLDQEVEDAVARLPLPDPHLTFGEARQLVRGRSAAHRRLQEQIKSLLE